MQQTDKYNLNIIETSDPFSPEALNENTEAIEAQLAAVRGEFAAADTALDGKLSAEKTRVDAALSTKADQTALAALAGRVGTLEQGRLLWTTGTYTGDGTYGEEHPTRLEFPFKPLIVIIKDPESWSYGGFPWLYGLGYGHSAVHFAGGFFLKLRWEDRAVEYYTITNNTKADHQLNVKGREYRYFLLGIEK